MGRTGFVHEAVAQDFPDLSGHEVYACGNPLMVDAARNVFVRNNGLAAENFLSDAFITRKETQVDDGPATPPDGIPTAATALAFS
jgi:CDP-4-dehydro-6-deoxyglucose reductase